MGVVGFGTSRGIMGREGGGGGATRCRKRGQVEDSGSGFSPDTLRRFQLAERDRRQAWALRLAELFNFRRGERRRSSRAWKLLRVYFGINATKPAFNLSLCGSSNTAAPPPYCTIHTHIYICMYI